MAAEGLSILLRRARELGIIKGVEISTKRVVVSHLKFADDSLLFCEADWVELLNLKRILRWFEILSGLKINYHRSVVCGVGASNTMLKDFAHLLNCKITSLP